MKTYQFRTNINCSGCVAKVKPYMDANQEIKHWEVETNKPEKLLTVKTENLTTVEIENILKNAGYKAEEIND